MFALLTTMPGNAFAQATVVAHGSADELYRGNGVSMAATLQPYTPYTGQTPSLDPVAIPKINYDYVWGMATDGRYVWCGLGANTAGIASSQISINPNTGELIGPNPSQIISSGGVYCRALEYAQSQYSLPSFMEDLRPLFGDWRPPRVFQHDAKTGTTVERTPRDPLLNITLGFRAGGVHNGVAIMAGPALFQLGVCMFAFDVESGRYLGSRYFPNYSNIRRFCVAGGELYTSMLNTDQTEVRGTVLRWYGNRLTPLLFDVVGEIDNEGAYLAEHEGRLYVGTWASFSYLPLILGELPERPPVAGIWMSPKLPARGGLRTRDANSWTKVWGADEYDPDPTLVLGIAMGPMESFQGKLYWGTLTFPQAGRTAFEYDYGGSPVSNSNRLDRDPLILRGDDFDKPTKSVELLYGSINEWVYHPQLDMMTGMPVVINGVVQGMWVNTTNNYGVWPLFGTDGNTDENTHGFDDSSNTYIWSSAVYKDKLYFGTFDQIAIGSYGSTVEVYKGASPPGSFPNRGGDVWCFSDHVNPAVAITRNGFGNQLIHGFRNMAATKYGLFFGSANSANLLPDEADAADLNETVDLPRGGWELYKLNE